RAAQSAQQRMPHVESVESRVRTKKTPLLSHLSVSLSSPKPPPRTWHTPSRGPASFSSHAFSHSAALPLMSTSPATPPVHAGSDPTGSAARASRSAPLHAAASYVSPYG